MNEILLAMCLSLGIADNCPRGVELAMPSDIHGAYGHNKLNGGPVILINSRVRHTNAMLRNTLEHELAHHFCQIKFDHPCAEHGFNFKKALKEVSSANTIKSVEIRAMRRVGDS